MHLLFHSIFASNRNGVKLSFSSSSSISSSSNQDGERRKKKKVGEEKKGKKKEVEEVKKKEEEVEGKWKKVKTKVSLDTYFSQILLTVVLVTHLGGILEVEANPDAKRLYDDLISRYNKLVRPVHNVSDPLTVHIKLKLSQLIEVNLKNQIMTTNLWVEQYWSDNKLSWDPREYGGVDMLHVPSDQIWRPDIVLYNNADGNFEVTLATKAILNSKGMIQWKPPAIYKSSCGIDVRYFPFDEQTCIMKFGSWTYDGFKVDLRHRDEVPDTNIIEMGIDLTEFYLSVEWDILEVPAIRNEKFYTCCVEPYIDITFNISMRRKTLFYTVNIVIPCMGISFLTVLVFYLPSDSGEKVALSVSILLSLTVFFLLLAEIIPPTSLVVPLLGKYLLFTMILVTLSILVTVIVLNVHFRSSSTHRMAPWVNKVFLQFLPKILMMSRPPYVNTVEEINPRLRDISSYEHRAHHHSSAPYFVTPSEEESKGKRRESAIERERRRRESGVETRMREEEEETRMREEEETNRKVICGEGESCDRRDFGAQTVNGGSNSSYSSGHSSPNGVNMVSSGRNVSSRLNRNAASGHHHHHHHHHLVPHDEMNGGILFNRPCRIHGVNPNPFLATSSLGMTTNSRFMTTNSRFMATNSRLMTTNPSPVAMPIPTIHLVISSADNSTSSGHILSGSSGHPPECDPNLFDSLHVNGNDGTDGRLVNGNHGTDGRLVNGDDDGRLVNGNDGTNDRLVNGNDDRLVNGNDGRLVIKKINFCPEFLKALSNVQFIADHTRASEEGVDVKEDWKFVAMVLDRLFLWIFTLAVLVGTCGIILNAPTLWDDREPIDQKLSEIALSVLNKRRQE